LYGRIVVALDGSREAEGVLPHAAALADRFGAEVLLVHVAAPVGRRRRSGAEVIDPDGETERLDGASANRYLRAVADRLGRAGRRVRGVVLEGVPSDEIVQYAAAARADLIALTTRGLGEQARLHLGSVADAVVRAAPCPVLLVRAERAARRVRARAGHQLAAARRVARAPADAASAEGTAWRSIDRSRVAPRRRRHGTAPRSASARTPDDPRSSAPVHDRAGASDGPAPPGPAPGARRARRDGRRWRGGVPWERGAADRRGA
jgi:nucleotide-binding universal stress UspA family protein